MIKNKHLSFIAFFILIAFFGFLYCAIIFTTNNNTVFAEEQPNSRLELYQSKINMVCDEQRTISRIKNLQDFAGNKYVLTETLPTGYFIFDTIENNPVEWSPDSLSPYLKANANLLYGGPKEYYEETQPSTRSANLYYKNLHTNSIDYNLDIDYLSERSNKVYKSLSLNNKSTRTVDIGGAGMVENYVNGYQVISALDEMCGYAEENGEGLCGYIALNLLVFYNYTKNNSWITNSSYLERDSDGTLCPSKSLTLELRRLGIARGFDNGSYSSQIRDVGNDYIKNKNLKTKHTSLWTPFFSQTTIKNHIFSERPIILFGSLTGPNSQKDAHAVLCYGLCEAFGKKYNAVHYGWKGYSKVFIPTSDILGSIYSIWDV